MSDQENTTAIQEEDVVVDTPKSRRETAMEEIEANRAKVIGEETGVEPEQTEEPEALVAKETPEPVIEKTEDEKQLESQLIDPSEKVRVKVKVDGVEEEIPLQDILRNYQKGSAADRRLEEATRLLRDVEERAKAQTKAESQKAQEVEDESPDLKEQVKQALSRLYDGDTDSAVEAFTALMSKNKPVQAPVQEIDTASLTQQIKQQLAAESAFETIKKDYPEVLSDPDLDQLASLKAQRMIENGTPRHEALLAAAKEVAEKVGKGRPAKVEQTTNRDEKLTRKAKLDNVSSAGVSAADTQQPTEDSSPSSVIAKMAAKRLGQSLTFGR